MDTLTGEAVPTPDSTGDTAEAWPAGTAVPPRPAKEGWKQGYALPSELRLHCVDSINHGLELFHHRPLVPSRPLGRILHVLDVFKLEVVQPCGIGRCEHPKEREQVRKLVPLWHIEADVLVIPHPTGYIAPTLAGLQRLYR